MRRSNRLLDLAEVSTLLGIGRDCVRRLIDAGRLHAVNVSPGKQRRTIRIPEYALDQFLSDQQIVPPAMNKQQAPVRPFAGEIKY